MSASSAARIVRPVYSTSSTSRMSAVVDRERNLGAADDRLRPDGVPHQVVAVERDVERAGRHVDAGESLAAAPASRAASGTPRARMPTSARSSTPRLRSRISCAMRVRLRDTRSASITTGMATPGPWSPTGRGDGREFETCRRAAWTSSRTRRTALKSGHAWHLVRGLVRVRVKEFADQIAASGSRPWHDFYRSCVAMYVTGCSACRCAETDPCARSRPCRGRREAHVVEHRRREVDDGAARQLAGARRSCRRRAESRPARASCVPVRVGQPSSQRHARASRRLASDSGSMPKPETTSSRSPGAARRSTRPTSASMTA